LGVKLGSSGWVLAGDCGAADGWLACEQDLECTRAIAVCLGIPMQIDSIDGFVARCTAKGVEREANLFMLQHEMPEVGDYVVVHLGYAMDRVSADEAAAAWAIYDEMLAADAAAGQECP
jgi:hydrogenase expression/formation protein HypC